MTTCIDCDQPATARGLCARDYQRRRRAGTLDEAPREKARKGEGRSRTLAVRVDAELAQAIDAEAERAGVTPSEVARAWIERGSRR